MIVYNLVYSFNPDAILIGGGVSNQHRIIEDIKKKIDEFDSRTTSFLNIDKCRFNNESGMIGAIYNYLLNNSLC